MTLTVLDDLIQGTDEWHDQRRGIVTASVVGKLLTSTGRVADNDTSRAITAQLVAERITGYTDPTFVNDDMLRGHEDEPRAIDAYSEHFGVPVQTVGMLLEDRWGWTLGYSPDGLVGDDGLVEVKAPRAKNHLATILSGEVPGYHMAQIQAGLLVSGRDWLDFISYSGGMRLWVKRVEPIKRWQAAIVDAVSAFETAALEMVAAYEAATADMPMAERAPDFEEMTL